MLRKQTFDDDDGAVSFMCSANCAMRADSQQCFRCNGHVNHNAGLKHSNTLRMMEFYFKTIIIMQQPERVVTRHEVGPKKLLFMFPLAL